MTQSNKHVHITRSQTYRENRGFTIVELMVVIVIIAISVALALPSWRQSVERRHVTSGAEQIASFVAFARGEAIKRGQEVTVSWKSDDSHSDGEDDWCIGLKLGTTACDCLETTTTDPDFCEIDGATQRLNQSEFADVGFEFFHAAPNNGNFSFDPVRGLINTSVSNLFSNEYLYYLHNDMKINGQRLYELQIRINRTGRIHICAEDDIRRSTIGGYAEC